MHRIESVYLVEEPIPKQDKTEGRYTLIQSRPLRAYYFGADPTRFHELDIALGDWGVSSWTTKHLTENIQPVALRAPEVLIRAPWDTKVDWWNLGAVILEIYRAIRLFDGESRPTATTNSSNIWQRLSIFSALSLGPCWRKATPLSRTCLMTREGLKTLRKWNIQP